MEKTMVVNNNLDMVKFLGVVESIAREYFNERGEYTPHVGLLNAMCVYYNECVLESKYDDILVRPVTEGIELRDVVSDKEFIRNFNDALNEYEYEMNFGTAYHYAMNIVKHRESSLQSIVDVIKNALLDLMNNVNDSIGKENVDKLYEMFENIKGSAELEKIKGIVDRAEYSNKSN